MTADLKTMSEQQLDAAIDHATGPEELRAIIDEIKRRQMMILDHQAVIATVIAVLQ
jgi:hypothetical protein